MGDALVDENKRLRTALMQAVTELRGDHFPAEDVKGRWCRICGPQDGSWPCVAEMVAADLLALLDGSGSVSGEEPMSADRCTCVEGRIGLCGFCMAGLGETRRVTFSGTALMDALNAERALADRLAQVLAWLLMLKDGPRDDAYREAKPLAWDKARAVLAEYDANRNPQSSERRK